MPPCTASQNLNPNLKPKKYWTPLQKRNTSLLRLQRLGIIIVILGGSTTIKLGHEFAEGKENFDVIGTSACTFIAPRISSAGFY
jgi:hypothetical protein